MRNFHENLVAAVLKHVKSGEQLDQWLRGDSMVIFEIGAVRGVYCGNQMLRVSDGGGVIDLDPGRVSGIRFELILREEDAELAFKDIVDKNNDLQAAVAGLKEAGKMVVDEYEGQIGELESEIGKLQEREVNFNKKIDLLQVEMDTSESDVETEGFSDDTKEKAGME